MAICSARGQISSKKEREATGSSESPLLVVVTTIISIDV